MPLRLPDPDRAEAVASLQRYSADTLDEPLGTLAAGALLDFFLEEIGPSLYNQGVADAQARLHAQVAELDLEIHEEAFAYWPARGQRRTSA
jgi:uncharacterized protein (DUF2164 family)